MDVTQMETLLHLRASLQMHGKVIFFSEVSVMVKSLSCEDWRDLPSGLWFVADCVLGAREAVTALSVVNW